MTIALQLELRIGRLARQQIARSLIPVSHCQHVACLIDAGHLCVQEVNDITDVPAGDSSF